MLTHIPHLLAKFANKCGIYSCFVLTCDSLLTVFLYEYKTV